MVVRVVRILDGADVEVGADAVGRVDGEQVLHRAALGGAGAFRQLIDLETVAHAVVGEEEHRGVHVGHVDMLDEVFVARGAGLLAHAAAGLGAELGQGGALDVAEVGDRDHDVLVGVEVFGVEFILGEGDLGAARVAVALL